MKSENRKVVTHSNIFYNCKLPQSTFSNIFQIFQRELHGTKLKLFIICRCNYYIQKWNAKQISTTLPWYAKHHALLFLHHKYEARKKLTQFED